MDFKEAHLTEPDILNTLWWMWSNQRINLGDVKFHAQSLDLEIEFITLDGYKFISKDKKITYSYDRKQ